MKKRLLSVLLALALTAAFGTAVCADEEKTKLKVEGVGWCGKTIQWLAVENADTYRLTVWHQVENRTESEMWCDIDYGTDGKMQYSRTGQGRYPEVTYDSENGVYTADISKYGFYSYDKYWFNFSASPKLSSKYAASDTWIGAKITGSQMRDGYTNALKQLPKGSTAFIRTEGGAVSVGSKLTAEYFISGLDDNNVKYVWQERYYSSRDWETVKVDGKLFDGKIYTVQEGDIGQYIRVRVEDATYHGYAASEPIQVAKQKPEGLPEIPELRYKDGKLYVTNPKENQEYTVSNRGLTKVELEDRWAYSDSVPQGCTELPLDGAEDGAINYVYSRIKETLTTSASDEVVKSSAYCGEITLKMTARTYDPEGGYEVSMMENRNTGEMMTYENYILRLSVEPSRKDPSFAGVDGKNFTCKKQDGTPYPALFCKDKECSDRVSPDTKYKDVYVKLPEAVSGLVFTATDNSSEEQMILNVGYSENGNLRVVLDSVTVPDITVEQGTVSDNASFYVEPDSADTSGRLKAVPSDAGNAPAVELTSYRTVKADATKAESGTYAYEVKYTDRNGSEQSMGHFNVTVVKKTEEGDSLILTADKLSLYPGESTTLTATLYPSGAKADVTWESSEPSVASVSDGTVIIVSAAPGKTADITATTGSGLSATCTVTVAGGEEEGKQPDKQDTGLKNPFVDVKEGSYYYDAVLWAYYAKPQVTNGMDETHFGPAYTVTRGQTVTFLWRAMGKPEPKTTANPFADVKAGDYYYKAVLWAVEEGITKGTDETHFTPDQTCSTAHIITFLYRTLGIGSDGWYEEAGAWAEDNGLLKDTGKTVSPDVNCQRCDVVVFLSRTVK